MRKPIAWLLTGLFLWFSFGLSGTLPVLASDNGDIAAESAAVSLKALNLFTGTRNGFDLYRCGTRAEGAVMLIRLLGCEPEALSCKAGHPFGDVPPWASGQIGLLYRMGLTTGISETEFGSDEPLTGRQYGTFVLRALGYVDSTDDVYVNAIPLLSKLGLLDCDDAVALSPDSPILRADMVKLASDALAVAGKGQSRTLMDNLVLRGQVPVAAAGKWLAGRLVPKLSGTLTDPYDKYLAFHDWLINKNSYGWLSETEDPKRLLSGQAYSALSFGTGICGAYARAMLVLCEAAGIPCRLVLGDAGGGTSGWTRHAWNLVQVDGSWYHMDVTFDDPVGVTVLRYNYFNVTDEELARDHRWDRTDYPECTATAGNWFVRNDLEVASMAEFNQSLAEMVQSHGTGITLRIKPAGTGTLNEGAVRDIMIGTRAVSGYTISLDSAMGVVRLTDVRYFSDGAG
jgi:hypothetical protein